MSEKERERDRPRLVQHRNSVHFAVSLGHRINRIDDASKGREKSKNNIGIFTPAQTIDWKFRISKYLVFTLFLRSLI